LKLFEKEEGSVVKALRGSSIFSGASAEDLKDVVSKSVERSYEPARVIIKQGDFGIGFYLILEGRVNITRNGKRIAALEKGNFFGEMSLLGKVPRSADVIALEPTRCLVLSDFNFWGIISTHPKIARGLITELAHRLQETDKAITE
jgi:CRP-like cAMP-binding protein